MTLSFSLIPLLALGLTIYYQFSKAYSIQIKEAVRALAENEGGSLELFLDERVSQLMTVINASSLERLKEEDYLKRLFLSLQARSKSFIDLGVIDQEGNHLAYVGPHYERLKSVNYAHEDWFAAVMSSGVYVSDVFLGFRKTPHFIIAVTRLEGNRTWILRATINSDIIDRIVRKAQLGRRGDAYIVNSRNLLQTTPRFGGNLLEHPNGPDFSHARGANVEEVKNNGESTLYATSLLTSPKWVLVVKQDAREELTPLFEAKYMGFVVVALGIFLVVSGTVFTTRSMTNELERMEVEKAKSDDLLVQSSKMAALGKMAAGIAHEINNPLAIIGEKAGWMRDLLDKEDIAGSENWQEFEDCIKKIERQVDRSRTITHRLLRFGRRMEPTQESVDVNAILSETITFLENEAHYREIEIHTHFEDKLPKLTTDSTQLQQVFLNIIDNGIDAVGRSGNIHLTTGYTEDPVPAVKIDITDDGPGIPREVLSRIFEPFYTTKRAGEGTGLGLSISFSIMEKLGGRIVVESEEGEGTTFHIFIPVK